MVALQRVRLRLSSTNVATRGLVQHGLRLAGVAATPGDDLVGPDQCQGRLVQLAQRVPLVETWDLPDSPMDMAVGFSNEGVGAEAICSRSGA